MNIGLMTRGVCALLWCGLVAGACGDDGGSTGTTNADSAANTGDSTGATDGPGATSLVDGTGTTAPGGSSEAGSTGGTDGTVTNDCGTFDPNQPGDGVIPQDPDDPLILDACNALCSVWLAVPNCTTEVGACLETCRLRSCAICPGTLAPLVECEAESFVEEGCTCGETGLQCEVPAACSDLQAETGFCGG